MSDLLKSLKALMVRCSLWDKVTVIDRLRLDTTHRMLNIPHFNAKMNALKEVLIQSVCIILYHMYCVW